MECLNKISFCKVKCKECDCQGMEETCPYHKIDCGGESVPSFKQWTSILEALLEQRHVSTDTLDKHARRSILATLEEFRTVMGYGEDEKVSVITRKTVAEYIGKLEGICNVSRKSKAWRLMQCFSRWIRREVEDKWTLPVIVMPEIIDDFQRFQEPPRELIVKIQRFYRSLYGMGRGQFKNRARLYTMAIWKYAMRPSDIDMLKWSDIKNVNGRHRLVYKPHKTRLTSKRVVKIWMNDLDYEDLMEFKANIKKGSRYDNEFVFGGGKNLSLKSFLNEKIKELGVKGFKKIYYLRKCCVHYAYVQGGSAFATAISGDNYDILRKHYLDEDGLDISPPIY